MYIHRVSLRNIRGFETLDFDLVRPGEKYAGWTVFTGDNGSGKSTFLKAIAVCLTGKDTARALQPSFHRWIRQGAGEAESSIELEITRVESDDELKETGRSPAAQFPAKIVLTNGGKETTLHTEIPNSVSRKTYQTPDRTIWSSEASGWFSCGYGPFRRVFGESPLAARQMVAPTTERFVTLFEESASLAEVDRWLRHLDHKKHEDMKAPERTQLDLLLKMLRHDLLPNRIAVDRVDSDGLWLKDRNGVEISWESMSDGYRAALALVTDILRHLISAYGPENLSEESAEGLVRITRSGVVLIDEIDAHLHPEWQREIGFWLKRHFPNIQFLVTTHSPIICQAADPNGLFVLPEPGSGAIPRSLSDEEYRTVIASRPDTILLTPAFGLQNTRSPRAVEARAELAKLEVKQRAGGKLTEEERRKQGELQLFASTDEKL